MSTAAVIASSNVAIANLAIANANANANAAQSTARAERCKVIVNGYYHDPVDVGAIHEYVDCADRLYPRDTGMHVPVYAKASIIALFVALAIGAISKPNDRIDGAIAGFLAWLFGISAALLIGLLFV